MISEHFELMFEAAKKARERAHVPYSKFKVGAAILTEDNIIISGCEYKKSVVIKV